MKIFSIKRTQTLPITQQEAWEFFSSPKNLDMITPKRMKFEILSISGGDKMYAGQIIRYKLQVFSFWTVAWVSEITHVQEPDFFVDDQRFGPYALWHHQHRFRRLNEGVEMTDEIHYAIPYGWIGRLANWLFVGREVNAIFDFRYQTLEQYFKKNVSKEVRAKP